MSRESFKPNIQNVRIALAKGQLYNQIIPIPSPPEQQKIADRLSSIDDLIATQTEKLDALNAHKKGLMQQLFPSPEDVWG